MLIARRVMIVGLLAWSLVLGSRSDAGAGGAQGEFQDVREATCTFAALTTGDWNEGEPTAEVTESDLSVRFVQISTDDATAEAVGQFGASDIIARATGEYLHLLQMFRVGPVYITTIFNQESRDGKLFAVHTRHEYTPVSLPGYTSRPEQYIGECDVK